MDLHNFPITPALNMQIHFLVPFHWNLKRALQSQPASWLLSTIFFSSMEKGTVSVNWALILWPESVATVLSILHPAAEPVMFIKHSFSLLILEALSVSQRGMKRHRCLGSALPGKSPGQSPHLSLSLSLVQMAEGQDSSRLDGWAAACSLPGRPPPFHKWLCIKRNKSLLH